MISVVMPVYNGEAFVARAVQSVLDQTSPRWEIVAVDDGSRDGTRAILEQFAARDPRIRVLHQENAGVSATRNAAMAAARGEYLAFLDADDWWYPDHLTTLEQMIRIYPKAGLLGTACDIRFHDGRTGNTAGFFEGKPKTLYLENFLEAYRTDKRAKCFALSSTCVRADAARQAGGFRVGCRIGEDLGLTLRIAAAAPAVLCARRTVLYNKAQSTATRVQSFDPDWYFFEEARALAEDPALTPERRASLARVMAWFEVRRVRHYLIDGRRREAWAAFCRRDEDPGLAGDWLLTGLLFLLPCALVRRIFLFRWRNKA